MGNCVLAALVSRNIFTTDNKVCFITVTGDGKQGIYNEDGQLVQLIKEGGRDYMPYMIHVNDKYLLLLQGYNDAYIYSLPGDGEATDVDEVSAPRRNNARKYINNDQVLIDSNDRTYTIQGQEVK